MDFVKKYFLLIISFVGNVCVFIAGFYGDNILAVGLGGLGIGLTAAALFAIAMDLIE